MIAAGDLNHRVSIMQPATLAQNAYGEATSGTTKLADVWASITAVTAREINIAKGFGATCDTKITIRYRSDLASKMTIVDGARSYNINGFYDPDGLKNDLVIFAAAVLP